MKLTIKGYAKEGMSREEFVNYWLTEHAPLVKQQPGIKKYVISFVISSQGEDPGYEGMAEIWADSIEDVQKARTSPLGKQISAQIPNFCRKTTSILVEEHTII